MMKKIKEKNICHILVIIFLVIFGIATTNVKAAGGQVSTPSGITFVKGDEELIPKPEEPKKTIIDSGKRLLPKTGEVVTKASLYGVSILILSFFYWIVLRRRRRNEE